MPRFIQCITLTTIAALPLYLIRFNLGPLPSTVLEILLLATILTWGMGKIKNAKLKIKNARQLIRSPIIIVSSLFLLAATVSIFIASDTRAALGVWRAYFVEPILFFLVVYDLLKSNRITRSQIIAALSISAILLSIYAIVQKFTGFRIPDAWITERRVTSIFPYPNALGLYVAPLIPLFIGQALTQLKKPRSILYFIFYIFNSLLCVLAIIFAHSTGALVGIAVGLSVMSFLYSIQKHSWKLFFTFLILHFAFAAIILSQPNLRQELLLRDWSGRVHKTQWAEAVTMLRDTSTPFGAGRPIFGAGLAGYQTALKPYHKATYIEIFQYPHNLFLTFWSETGLLGLLSFLGLIVAFVISAVKKLVISHWSLVIGSTIAALVIILVHGLVDVPYFKNDLAVMFWILYALAVAPIKQSAHK